ncbi:hypothetical protein [Vitreimonas flagellata]|uniref:hypothetical protein n=1 Tax=Vitreimonas flagellata TaxID=2560861 RepID=UPI0010754E9D|nr:hypothetical protein [Vitreimonas flagellata]
MMRTILAALAVLACVGCASAQAQPAAASPCSMPEFRQMDFWVGVWDVRWEAASGMPAGQGVNTITRAYGDCVIQEAFDGGPATGGLIGHSVSTYHAPLQHWRQTWVDNQGGYFALVGGPEGDDFVLVSSRVSDNTPVQRMVFTEITPNSLTWRWQRTPDGGATWADQWVIHYTRRSR